MRVERIVKEHVAETRRKVDTRCDSCHELMRRGSWEDNQIEVIAKIGSVYPETDTRKGYRVDLCVECFQCKLLPFLGTIATVQEWDCGWDDEPVELEEPKANG